MRRGIFAFLALAGFLALVLVVALRRQPPVIPGDDVHIPARGNADACLACHGPDGPHPRGPNHPFGLDCRRCHYEAGEAR